MRRAFFNKALSVCVSIFLTLEIFEKKDSDYNMSRPKSLKRTVKISLNLTLAGSVMMTTACGVGGYGVGRNPLGSNVRLLVTQAAKDIIARNFKGNPDNLRALFLRPQVKGQMVVGENFPLEVIALDANGDLIDPLLLNLAFSSAKPGTITVDENGILKGVIPYEGVLIKVTDTKSQTSAEVEFTAATNKYTGNPRALATLQLVQRSQVTPGQNQTAQFMIIARDTLGNPIDPSRLQLDWSVGDPTNFKVDKEGVVTAITLSGDSQVTVRDPISGKIAIGTVQNIFSNKNPLPTQTGSGNAVTSRPDPVPNGTPGVPAAPTAPSQGDPNPLQPLPDNSGTASGAQSLTLAPALSLISPGDRVQLNVSVTDGQGRPINLSTLPLQWTSSKSGLPVDQKGLVSGNEPGQETTVTVSIPGTNLTANAIVRTFTTASSSGGGGGGGGGGGSGIDVPIIITPPLVPAVPKTSSTPLSTTSFTVKLFPPTASPAAILEYVVTVNGFTFTIPAAGATGPVTAPVPAGANLSPDTIYPYSAQAKSPSGELSAVVNSFGTTLKLNLAPTNMIGGSSNFSGVVSVPANTPIALKDTNGNALSAGDGSNAETLQVTFQPTAGTFGTVSISSNPLPGTVTITGAGTQASPLVIKGPKDDVNTVLNNFVYTPQNGFVGPATVTMTTSDTVEGIVTPDDADTLVFNVNSATATPPRNLMNGSPTFSNLLTASNTAITLRPLNNSHLGVEDINGDTVTTVLTPANGTIALITIPAGVTVTGNGTAASPLQLVGPPFYVSSALNGGLTFTPTANFVGTGTIQMVSTATDGSDTDTVSISVVSPSNLFNGSTTFPATAQQMAKSATTVLNGAGNKALNVLYPPTSTVTVTLTLLDKDGANAGNIANGNLTVVGATSGNGTAEVTLTGPVATVNALLTAGVTYSPNGTTTGNFRLRMNSVDTVNGALTDTNDIVFLEVSEPPVNKYNNNAAAFPPSGNPIELGYNTPLTFASFFGTALSVFDGDSASVTTTLTPTSNGTLSRANLNAIPAGVTVTVGATVASSTNNVSVTATNAQPMVIVGSPTNINLFLNNGIVFSPNTNQIGAATVTMSSFDGGATDTDIAHINILDKPENRRNDSATFITTPILAAPGVAAIMKNPNEFTITGPPLIPGPMDRLLTVKNYPSAANVDVTLSVPAGKGTLLLNGFAGANGVSGSVTYTGNGTTTLQMTGTQANLNTALTNLRYTPAAGNLAAPETVNITMSSTGGTLGDSGDTVSFFITNPPLNVYNGSTVDGNFPSGGTTLQIFANQDFVLNNTATATQPAAILSVNDDSTNVKVTITPANGAILALTAAAPGTVNVTGGVTANTALVLNGPTADVQTAMGLLKFTPATDFTGPTTLTVVSDDGGPSPDTNTVNLNVKVRPENEFNTTTTNFPGANIPMVIGLANPINDDGTGVNTAIHEIGVKNLSSYIAGQTATVRLQIPAGTLGINLTPAGVNVGDVAITAGANNSGDLTLSATHPNIAIKLNDVLKTLTWTPPALADGAPATTPAVLTMTHGPIPDTDTLNFLATRPPLNRYNGLAAFPGAARIVNENVDLTFTAADTVSVGSAPNELVEDSPIIKVSLQPSLVGGSNSGTVSITTSGSIKINGAGTASLNGTVGTGTNAAPLTIEGSPTDVNNTLLSLKFTSANGINGAATISMTTTDFGARDVNDLINLDIRAKPSNQNNGSNTFPGTGSPFNVGLNTTYALDGNSGRPKLGISFYQPTDSVTVHVNMTGATTDTLTLTNTGLTTYTGDGTTNLTLVGSPSNINASLASLIYHSPNVAHNVDITMDSDNGVGGADPGVTPADVLRLRVQNQPPVNSLTGTTSGFTQGATTLPLNVVNDTTTVDDGIDFGQIDPTSAAAGNLTVTTNTWPTLSVADDNTTVTTTASVPVAAGKLDFRAGALNATGAGTNTVTWTNKTPAQINADLALLKFIPNAGAGALGTHNLTIVTNDGVLSDTDTLPIKIEAPNLPSTFSSNPNPSGTVFRAVYQFGRDKLPQIVVNDITVSGPELQAGAQIEIIRYNDNNPTNAGDDDTDVIRTVTLNAPNAALGESVSFDNKTNRATVTVNFSFGTSPVLSIPPAGSPVLNEGTGKLGGRLVNGNVDTPSVSSVAAANHPYFYFVFPERTQYAVEDYFVTPPSTNNRGRWYLVNTTPATGAGDGRLSMIFDSNSTNTTGSTPNIQNGLNATKDVTTGLAKNPLNGDVYYVDDQGASAGRLIRWIPSLGIQNDRGGADSATDPFLDRGNMSVNNGSGNTYSFNDKPARMVFNSPLISGVKSAVLYSSASFNKNDTSGNLSGFYRVRNFESGALALDNIRLIMHDTFGDPEELGLFSVPFNNTGDIVFEPDDAVATDDNRMFLTTGSRIFVSRLPVPNSGTADVLVDEVTMPVLVRDTLKYNGVAATDFVGLSIDGGWATGSRSFLVIARYPAPNDTVSRLYRIAYTLVAGNATTPTAVTLTGATLLNNGNFDNTYPFTTFNPVGPIPLVDITAAHLP
jgi:hypothetical protein